MDPETRFREVFELAYAPLCRYARHRGLTGPDAEDVVAQTMEIAWRRIGDMPATEPLPWLYAVAHNVWRNTARRDHRRRELLARFRMRSADGARQDPGGLEPGALRAALASLSDDDQEILRLVAWDGLAPAEIAVVLVRDNQFWYIKSWGASQVCQGVTGKCAMTKPHEAEIWQSVSNECVTGLLRAYGQSTPLVFSTNYLHCPYRGGVHDPTYRFLQTLPTDPHALLSLIEQEMQGQLPRPVEAFTTIGDMISTAIAPPAVSASLYRAAALIPGVTVVPDATDAINRHGVAVAMTFRGVRTEWIFSKHTFQYLGAREIDAASGATNSESAVLERAFVDHAGQIPG